MNEMFMALFCKPRADDYFTNSNFRIEVDYTYDHRNKEYKQTRRIIAAPCSINGIRVIEISRYSHRTINIEKWIPNIKEFSDSQYEREGEIKIYFKHLGQCKYCKEYFVTNSKLNHYCSNKCKHEYHNKSKRVIPKETTCSVCNNPFTPKRRNDAQTCSNACRQKLYRLKSTE